MHTRGKKPASAGLACPRETPSQLCKTLRQTGKHRQDAIRTARDCLTGHKPPATAFTGQAGESSLAAIHWGRALAMPGAQVKARQCVNQGPAINGGFRLARRPGIRPAFNRIASCGSFDARGLRALSLERLDRS